MRFLLLISLVFFWITNAYVSAQYVQTHDLTEVKKVSELKKWQFNQMDWGVGVDNDHYGEISLDQITDETVDLVTIMVLGEITKSKKEARRLIEGGGISLNSEKIENIEHILNVSDLKSGDLVLKKGKKKFFKLLLNFPKGRINRQSTLILRLVCDLKDVTDFNLAH